MSNDIEEDAPQQNGDGEDPDGNGAQENGRHGQDDGQAATALGIKEANKIRVTTPYMTKYERARVLGTRALQIR